MVSTAPNSISFALSDFCDIFEDYCNPYEYGPELLVEPGSYTDLSIDTCISEGYLSLSDPTGSNLFTTDYALQSWAPPSSCANSAPLYDYNDFLGAFSDCASVISSEATSVSSRSTSPMSSVLSSSASISRSASPVLAEVEQRLYEDIMNALDGSKSLSTDDVPVSILEEPSSLSEGDLYYDGETLCEDLTVDIIPSLAPTPQDALTPASGVRKRSCSVEEDLSEEEDAEWKPAQRLSKRIKPLPSTTRKPTKRKSSTKRTSRAIRCSECSATFTRDVDRRRHVDNIHESKPEVQLREEHDDKVRRWCKGCNFVLSRLDARRRHESTCTAFLSMQV